MKKFLKAGVLTVAVAMIVATMFLFAGCGGSAEISGVYSMQTYRRDISDFGTDWIMQADYNLIVFSDNTYILQHSVASSGTTDQASRGENITIYYGTYTSSVSADLGEGYTDFTLNKATRVIYYQHLQMGQYFGGEYYADTAAAEWSEETAEMTGAESAEAYLEKMAKGFTLSVNDATALITAVPVEA